MNNTIYRSTIAWLILVSDIIGLFACFNLVFFARFERFIDWYSPLLDWLIPVCLLGLYLADTYKADNEVARVGNSDRLLLSVLVSAGATASAIYFAGLWSKGEHVEINVLLPSLGLFSIWAVFWRLLAGNWIEQKARKSRWLIVAGGEKAIEFAREYKALDSKAELVFLIAKEEEEKACQIRTYGLVNSTDTFKGWTEQDWSGIVRAEEIPDTLSRELMHLRLQGTRIYTLSDFYEQVWQKIPSSSVKDDWFILEPGFNLLHGRANAKIKRIVDSIAAIVLLSITFPLALLSAIAIKLDSPGPIFYHQTRTGLNGKTFKVHKFRSMYQDAEKRGAQWTTDKDPRITRAGSILRVMRIDELPQLWNVLKGEMSLIGPRPERPEFDEKLRQQIPYYDVRYSVKPGITGWAQVNYSYGSSVEDAYQKLAYDLYYIKNYSLLMDLAISLKTVKVVILGKGR